MNTISAAVTGARHLRAGRNGQDAAASWRGVDRAAIVVCDGCGSSPSSEVGARLGAGLWIRAVATRLVTGALVWEDVRADVVEQLAAIAARMPDEAVRECFLFTIVSAAIVGDEVSVWALGDGVYSIDGRSRVLGPFVDNQPPYLGYDLIGERHTAHVEVARGRSVIVATDGAQDLDVDAIATAGFSHPDGLRRRLTVLARASEHVDWDERRIVRAAALLQDDCAIAAVRS
jgi:hypothetical protein